MNASGHQESLWTFAMRRRRFSLAFVNVWDQLEFSSQYSGNEHGALLLRKSQYAILQFVSSRFVEQQTQGRHAHSAHHVDAGSWSA